RAAIKRGTLSEDARRNRLLPPQALGPLGDAFSAVRETLEEIYPPPPVAGAVPVAQLNDPAFKVCVVDAQRTFGVQAEGLIAPEVPGGVLLVDMPRPQAYLSAQLVLNQSDGERRFLIGRALEPLRGGYGMLTRLRAGPRAEVLRLIEQLFKPESERDPKA